MDRSKKLGYHMRRNLQDMAATGGYWLGKISAYDLALMTRLCEKGYAKPVTVKIDTYINGTCVDTEKRSTYQLTAAGLKRIDKTPTTCAVTDCDRTDIAARGWCTKHYGRWRRGMEMTA